MTQVNVLFDVSLNVCLFNSIPLTFDNLSIPTRVSEIHFFVSFYFLGDCVFFYHEVAVEQYNLNLLGNFSCFCLEIGVGGPFNS